MAERAAPGPSRLTVAGLASLLVIWFVWGSTYLAIRIAVRPGAGFGPFWLGASRVLIAGAVLLAVAMLWRRPSRPARGELLLLGGSGLLMWVGGNGGVNWAEQRVDSGLVALVVGTMPIWVAIIEAVLDRRAPSPLLVGSLLTGFAGLAVLTVPLVGREVASSAAGVAVVLLGTLSWGVGSIMVNRRPVTLGPLATSGLQQLAGGAGFILLALGSGEGPPTPTPAAWGAWAYLVVFGSLLAFTCYVVALKSLPTTLVMTYTYVNPVIAVSLGWMVLGEPITGWTVVAAGLILLGVGGVMRSRRSR